MAGRLILRIDTDDKGNIAIKNLKKNTDKANKSLLKTGNIMKLAFVATAVQRGIQMIAAQLRKSVDNALQFEQAMKRIQAISGKANVGGLQKINKEIREMALNTEYTTSQIAKGMLEVTKAGFSENDALKAMPSLLDLATAGMSDLNWASSNAIDVMNAFGFTVNDMPKIADVITASLNKSKLGLEDYMEAMKFSMPVAKSLGVSFEELSATIAILANMGLRGSIAGNAMKNTMLNLLKTTPEVKKALEGMNVEGMSLTDILDEIHKSGISVQGVLEQFNKRAIVSALALGENADKVRAFQKELENAGGTAAETAKIMREALIERFKNLGNIFNEVVLKLMDIAGPEILDSINSLAGELKTLAGWIENNKDFLEDLLKVTKKFSGFIINNLLVNLKSYAKKLMDIITAGYRWEKQLDNMEKNVNKSWVSQKHAEDLLTLLGLMQNVVKYQDMLADLHSQPAGQAQETMLSQMTSELESSEQAVKSFNDQLKKDFGRDYAGKDGFVMLQSDLHSILTLLNKVEETPETPKIPKIPKIPKKPYGDNTGGDSGGSTFWTDLIKRIGDYQKKMKDLREQEAKAKDMVDKQGDADAEEWAQKELARKRAVMAEVSNTIVQGAADTANLLNAIWDAHAEEEWRRLEKRRANIEKSYRDEVQLAQGSDFKKAIAKEKYEAKMAKIQEKSVAKQKELAKKNAIMQLIILNAQAVANGFAAVVGAIAGTQGGIITRLAAGAAIGAEVAGLVASMIPQIQIIRNARAGDIVQGNGNATSDNIPYNLSPGERVLSNGDVDRLGGQNQITQMIDRGSTYSSSKTVHVHIQNFVGKREQARELIPYIEKELSR